MATRAPRPTRFSRESKSAVVDIDQARIETGRRIEKGTEQGKPFLQSSASYSCASPNLSR